MGYLIISTDKPTAQNQAKATMVRIIPNMTDNFDFHRREYITIRPWIKACIEEMGIECEVRDDNESLFLLKSIEDVEDAMSEFMVDDLINNKYSTAFIQEYLAINKLPTDNVSVLDLLHHEHATTIFRTMLDALTIFVKYGPKGWDEKVFKWIDEDNLYMLPCEMIDDELKIINDGAPFIQSFIDEKGYSGNPTFENIRNTIALFITDKEGSVEYLKSNLDFICEDVIALNPRWKEFEEYCYPTTDDICRNYGAIELLKNLSPNEINWTSVSTFHRDVQFIEDNIDKVNWESILMNDYMMPVIERHIDKVDLSLKTALSSNTSAIYYLEQHPELIDEGILSNSNIVTYDYDRIKRERLDLNRELREYIYHPRFIQKWLDDGNDIEDYMN